MSMQIDQIVAHLRDNDPVVRRSAIQAIEKEWETGIAEPLLSALEDEDMYVRMRSAELLGKMREKRAVVPLRRALEDREFYVRVKAARSLGIIGDVQAVESLIEALDDKESAVRWEAAWALGEIGDRNALPHLMIHASWLRERAASVRTVCRQAIEKIEVTTREMKSLPRPSASPIYPLDTLPIPAGGSQPEDSNLPRPANLPGENADTSTSDSGSH